ncbi:MAG TPA: hypothetical protein VD903_12030, partial [Pseudonocardia sp.]|nr:hypothetical protein [Pseudonocardia sp.]
RLLFQPGVMVTSVPWQLRSSERMVSRRPETPPGASRRGYEPVTRDDSPAAPSPAKATPPKSPAGRRT